MSSLLLLSSVKSNHETLVHFSIGRLSGSFIIDSDDSLSKIESKTEAEVEVACCLAKFYSFTSISTELPDKFSQLVYDINASSLRDLIIRPINDAELDEMDTSTVPLTMQQVTSGLKELPTPEKVDQAKHVVAPSFALTNMGPMIVSTVGGMKLNELTETSTLNEVLHLLPKCHIKKVNKSDILIRLNHSHTTGKYYSVTLPSGKQLEMITEEVSYKSVKFNLIVTVYDKNIGKFESKETDFVSLQTPEGVIHFTQEQMNCLLAMVEARNPNALKSYDIQSLRTYLSSLSPYIETKSDSEMLCFVGSSVKLSIQEDKEVESSFYCVDIQLNVFKDMKPKWTEKFHAIDGNLISPTKSGLNSLRELLGVETLDDAYSELMRLEFTRTSNHATHANRYHYHTKQGITLVVHNNSANGLVFIGCGEAEGIVVSHEKIKYFASRQKVKELKRILKISSEEELIKELERTTVAFSPERQSDIIDEAYKFFVLLPEKKLRVLFLCTKGGNLSVLNVIDLNASKSAASSSYKVNIAGGRYEIMQKVLDTLKSDFVKRNLIDGSKTELEQRKNALSYLETLTYGKTGNKKTFTLFCNEMEIKLKGRQNQKSRNLDGFIVNVAL